MTAEKKPEPVVKEVISAIDLILNSVRLQHPAMQLRLAKDQKVKGDIPGPLNDHAISAYNCMAGAQFLKLEKLWQVIIKLIGDLHNIIDELKKQIEDLKIEKNENETHIVALEKDVATATRRIEELVLQMANLGKPIDSIAPVVTEVEKDIKTTEKENDIKTPAIIALCNVLGMCSAMGVFKS